MLDEPVDVIPGIGPATSEALQSETIHVVGDLLRVPATRIHDMVDSLASLEECEAWRSIAGLLQVESMTVSWASALVEAGLHDVEHVARGSHSDLLAALAETEAPSDADTVQAMAVDARTLRLCGALMVLVVDTESVPVEGVAVRVAASSAVTDARGRCHFTRIAFPSNATVSLTAEGFQPVVAEDVPIAPFSMANDVLRIEIARLPEGAAAEPLPALDEWDGDEIPELTSYNRRTQFVDGPLRDDDYLFLARRYANGDELKLTSIFRRWEAGTLVAVAWRMPVDVLPSDAPEGQLYRHRSGAFSPRERGPFQLERYRARRRVLLQLSSAADWASLTFHEALERYNVAMRTATVVGRQLNIDPEDD